MVDQGSKWSQVARYLVVSDFLGSLAGAQASYG
jgi:hypothetical protein